MNNQSQAALATIAAFLVLFSAMIDPRASVVLALVGLLSFSVYKLLWAPR
ncbi:MAG: hypothetical protein IT331_14710 [Anaerolineae bacterium]|nr:hypothetical protein [Anaerolineae bacterium]